MLAISTDSIYAHQAYQRDLEAPFPLLSDFSRETATAYGVLNPETDARGFKNAIIRSVFVVDRNGKIRYRFASEDPSQLPEIEEVLAATREVVSTG